MKPIAFVSLLSHLPVEINNLWPWLAKGPRPGIKIPFFYSIREYPQTMSNVFGRTRKKSDIAISTFFSRQWRRLTPFSLLQIIV